MSWMPKEENGEWLVVENGGERIHGVFLCKEDAEDTAEQLNTHEAEDRFRPNWLAIACVAYCAMVHAGWIGALWRHFA